MQPSLIEKVVPFLAGLLLCTASSVAPGDSFRVPERAPDVFGGWASTHVLVRVVPGVEPGLLDDGRWSLLDETRPQAAETERALTELLERWQVVTITPTAVLPPQDAVLAGQLGLDRYHTIHVPMGTDTPALVEELNAFPSHIELAELDGVGGALRFPSDSYFSQQYGLHNTGQTIEGQTGTPDADIDAPEAWDLHTGSADIVLAMIDTGVSESHPDLAGKLIAGRNTYDDNNDTDDSWFISHGTHCAGIAAANSNNNRGVAGVSWGARIMPIKVLNWLGSGTESQCANGVIWAADHGAHVGSMSLGYPDGTSYFRNAIIYAHDRGMVLVAAAGNTPGSHFYPALWSQTITVAATDNRDNLASFSSYGAEVSVAAPGVDVYSCWDVLWDWDTYAYESGTSMACPHVSGLACLVWSANLDLTNDDVRSIIESTADDKGSSGWDQYYGYGRVNALYAVDAALNASVPWDLNGDGCVDQADLGILLGSFGINDGGDIDGDGDTDQGDLGALLAHWGEGCG